MDRLNPEVSVIIPTHNRKDMLLEAMESVLAQSFKDFELIVVDDGSDDGTGEIVTSFISSVSTRSDSPRVTLLTQPQRGVSAARNAGVAKANGSLIAFLDSDDCWLDEKLAVQVSFFHEKQDALICQTEETWIRNGIRVNPRNKHEKPSGDIFFKSLKLCLVSPSAVMLRKELFSELGLFDEDLIACEDYDLWLRISAHYPVHLILDPLVVKRGGHTDQLSRTVPSLDKYRVWAMLKLLVYGSLNQEQVNASLEEITIKANIYGKGCLKRGKTDEGNEFLNIAQLCASKVWDEDLKLSLTKKLTEIILSNQLPQGLEGN